MPSQQRLRLDEHQRFAPTGEQRRQTNQHEPISRAQFRPLHLANSNEQLVAQEGVLSEQLLRERVRSSTKPPIAPLRSPAGATARRTSAPATPISHLSCEPSPPSTPRSS